MSNDALLIATLEVAVPMWIDKFKREKVPLEKIVEDAHELAQVIAEKGDVIQFKSKKRSETGTAFNALAKAIAAMSFMPGGVKVFGLHFESKIE